MNQTERTSIIFLKNMPGLVLTSFKILATDPLEKPGYWSRIRTEAIPDPEERGRLEALALTDFQQARNIILIMSDLAKERELDND